LQKGNGQQGPGRGQGAGEEPGIDYYEAEFTLDELAAMIFEDLGLPNLEEKKMQTISSPSVRFNDPRGGRYEIWVGTYGSASYEEGELHISELYSQ
jgi:uncharacterized sporulation protein YeaH/YhbH (DUF444 family)